MVAPNRNRVEQNTPLSLILTPKQRKALEGLVLYADIVQAAKHADCSRDSIYRWLKEPQFVQELRHVEQLAIDELGRGLARISKAAIETVEKAMKDPDAKLADRLRAADIALGNMLRVRQMAQVEYRVEQLELALRMKQPESTIVEVVPVVVEAKAIAD